MILIRPVHFKPELMNRKTKTKKTRQFYERKCPKLSLIWWFEVLLRHFKVTKESLFVFRSKVLSHKTDSVSLTRSPFFVNFPRGQALTVRVHVVWCGSCHIGYTLFKQLIARLKSPINTERFHKAYNICHSLCNCWLKTVATLLDRLWPIGHTCSTYDLWKP